MQQGKKNVQVEAKGWGYHDEALDDIETALWYIHLFQSEGGTDFFMIVKARKYLDMAISRYNYGEKLLGNTLEEYIKEEKKT